MKVDKVALREKLQAEAKARFEAAKEGRTLNRENPGAVMNRELLGAGVRSLDAPMADLMYQDEVELDPSLPDEVRDGVLSARMTKQERVDRVRRMRAIMVRSTQREG